MSYHDAWSAWETVEGTCPACGAADVRRRTREWAMYVGAPYWENRQSTEWELMCGSCEDYWDYEPPDLTD